MLGGSLLHLVSHTACSSVDPQVLTRPPAACDSAHVVSASSQHPDKCKQLKEPMETAHLITFRCSGEQDGQVFWVKLGQCQKPLSDPPDVVRSDEPSCLVCLNETRLRT